MPASKKPKKKYVPRRVIANPLAYVLQGVRPMEHDKRTTLRIINHASLSALVTGQGTLQDWENVTGALNVASALAEIGFGKHYVPDIHAAMKAHAECGARLTKHGKFGYSGPELQQVNHAMDIHDAQMDEASVSELEKAYELVLESQRKKQFVATVKELVPA